LWLQNNTHLRRNFFHTPFETEEIAKVAKAINQLGKAREPFFFLFDFLLKKPVVVPLKHWSSAMGNISSPLWSSHETAYIKKVIPSFTWNIDPIDFPTYEKIFSKVQEEIFYGNSYLLNLTQPTKVTTNLSLQQIYDESPSKFKLLWDNQFVSFSPERFVEVRGNRIFTHPMKGTISADLEGAAEIILNDVKEKAEHYTIVDLLRNDLSQVAKEVRVNSFRYLTEVQTHKGKLLQVSSEIAGLLPENWRDYLGDWMVSLLPAGSISGAPKKKTVEIITQNEGYHRGYYTGIYGIFDGENLDSAVAIRFLEKAADGFVFKSGGGITALSKAEDEYKEMIEKVYVPINRNDMYQGREGATPAMAPATLG
jgi:para-aminobenzoate synthetase component 1